MPAPPPPAPPPSAASARGERPALVPRFGPLPAGWGWIVALSLGLAWILCLPASADPDLLVGGAPDLPGLSHTTSQMALRGPALWAHSRMLMYPAVHNFYAQVSFPADGLPGGPFLWLLGWPAGFTAFTVATLAALGVSTGLFVASWWRSAGAGLVGAVAAETSGIVLREVYEGRLTHVLGLVFAPIAVALYARALVEDRGRHAFWAGVAVGLSALVFWYQAVWVGLMLLVVLAAGLGERLRVFRHMVWGAAGTFAVAGFPILYTVLHAGAHPGNEVGAWSLVEEVPGTPIVLVELLEQRDAEGMGWTTGAWGMRPVLVALCLLGMWRARARRVFAPVLWIVVAWALASGPIWGLPGATVLSPIFAQSFVPLMRRFWWPDRYLVVATVGVAVLAGGAVAVLARRLRAGAARRAGLVVLVGALGVEAYVALPTLPMAATPGGRSERVEALARGTGPTLILPPRDLAPEATYRVWSADAVLDQVHHRRPLLSGPMNPEAIVAGPEYRQFWSTGALAALRRCEEAVDADPADLARPDPTIGPSLDRLYRAGVRELYADPAREGTPEIAAAWRTCLERILGPPDREEGPYRVYRVRPPASAAVTPTGS